MNINTDYDVRRTIAALAQLVENVERDGPPSRNSIETKLEDFSDAIIQAAVHVVLKKLKTADHQVDAGEGKQRPATQS